LRSHASGSGGLVHVSTPFVHCFTPPAHSPCWLLHSSPTSGRVPSSTCPLQSLSLPSQISGPSGTHGPASSVPLSSVPPSSVISPSPPLPPSPVAQLRQ